MNVPEEVKAIDPVAGVVQVTPKGLPVIEPVVIVFVHATFVIERSDPLFDPNIEGVDEITRILKPEPLAVPEGIVILIVPELAIDANVPIEI